MKHAFSIRLSLRQPGFTRGQRWWEWVADVSRDTYDLARWGGHGSHTKWWRLTVFGVSLQLNIEHDLSNWSPRGHP
jgi:hypothetical protein